MKICSFFLVKTGIFYSANCVLPIHSLKKLYSCLCALLRKITILYEIFHKQTILPFVFFFQGFRQLFQFYLRSYVNSSNKKQKVETKVILCISLKKTSLNGILFHQFFSQLKLKERCHAEEASFSQRIH